MTRGIGLLLFTVVQESSPGLPRPKPYQPTKVKDLASKAKDWDSKAEDLAVRVKAKTKDSFTSFTLGQENA